jgi:hypothetical protein
VSQLECDALSSSTDAGLGALEDLGLVSRPTATLEDVMAELKQQRQEIAELKVRLQPPGHHPTYYEQKYRDIQRLTRATDTIEDSEGSRAYRRAVQRC